MPRFVSEPVQEAQGGRGCAACFFYACRNCFTEVSNMSEDNISLKETNQAYQHETRTV
jgi:hypothetical protein